MLVMVWACQNAKVCVCIFAIMVALCVCMDLERKKKLLLEYTPYFHVYKAH